MMKALRLRARKSLAAYARRLVFPCVEHFWTLAFKCAGCLLCPAARRRIPDGTERVLVVAPHPDDETLGCGGTIALHQMSGDAVCVVVVTDGGSSRAGRLSRREMVDVRRKEAEAAMSALAPSVRLVFLGLQEGTWTRNELELRLLDVIEQFRPTLIYTTSCVDFHPQHIMVAEGLAGTLYSSPHASRVVRVYEVQVPLTPVLANVIVDVGSVMRRKVRAISRYESQFGSFAWVERHRRYLRTLYGNRGPVEVFWELEPEQFCRVMSRYREVHMRFRGIRVRPVSDGLAWVVGLNGRKKLKRLAGSGHAD